MGSQGIGEAPNSIELHITPKLKVGAVIVLLLVAIAVAVLVTALGSRGTERPAQRIRPGDAQLGASTESAAATIYVHLLGAVNEPGLYELPEDARAIDAVAAAGGYTEKAVRSWLNLARFLSDGEQVYVPELGEEPPDGATASGTVGGKVNLNTADATVLETLPRVGPAMAARIIAWREANGRFASIEDLRGVSGIGEKTFAALAELVTV